MKFELSDNENKLLREAVHSKATVTGFTHNFYNYPARFSPLFAETVIDIFTEPGDLVLDPFMGGGTTLVAARLSGRYGIGTDINELSTFLAKAKTKITLKKHMREVICWATDLKGNLNLHNPPIRAKKWIDLGYQRNINSRNTWPIRKTLEFILVDIENLKRDYQRLFARCALMKTAQWALDCTTNIPTGSEFRDRFLQNVIEMANGAIDFSNAVRESDQKHNYRKGWRTICLNKSVIGLEQYPLFKSKPAPRLILTSPPYPGVHVLYHRWQINGRRETPAPYWIANARDSQGESYYTFGGRHSDKHFKYYDTLKAAYTSLSKIADQDTLLVQLVGFSEPKSQLQKYIETMEDVGFQEYTFPSLANKSDGRIWRNVPNRKWYAQTKRSVSSSKEVVLFHSLA
jgi:hypothetical protein